MSSIYPVIVIYKAKLEECSSYTSLLKPAGVREFLIYDNSPADCEGATGEYPAGITYVRDTENSGLPKAYNLAAKLAGEKGFSHVLLLDQDTTFPDGAWAKYVAASDYSGLVAPCLVTNRGKNFSPMNICGWRPKAVCNPVQGEYSLCKFAFVNSGCLLPVSLFEAVGGYDESVKLDFADYQFQRRLRKVASHALLIDLQGVQDFSNDCSDVARQLSRYRLFLESARHCHFDTRGQQLKHLYVVLRQTLALTLHLRSLRFFRCFVQNYCW